MVARTPLVLVLPIHTARGGRCLESCFSLSKTGDRLTATAISGTRIAQGGMWPPVTVISPIGFDGGPRLKSVACSSSGTATRRRTLAPNDRCSFAEEKLDPLAAGAPIIFVPPRSESEAEPKQGHRASQQKASGGTCAPEALITSKGHLPKPFYSQETDNSSLVLCHVVKTFGHG